MKLAKRELIRGGTAALKIHKREPASHAARRELGELIEIIVRQRIEGGPFWSLEGPPPAPGTWPATQLERLLRLAAEHGKLYAYTWILHLWLEKNGVPIPSGVFAKKISSPGTGPKPDEEKRKFGQRAWNRQIELIVGNTCDLTEEELASKSQAIWAAAPSYKASQIAMELTPRKYHGSIAKREAARKYVAEAIALVKPTPEDVVEKVLAANHLDDIMGAKPPFD